MSTPSASPAPTDTTTLSPTPDVIATPTATDTSAATPSVTLMPTPTDIATQTATPDITVTSTPNPTANQPTGPPAPPTTQEQQQGQILDGVSATPTPTATPVQPTSQGHLETSIVNNAQAATLDLTSVNTSSATLTTNKADYAPTDTALITGNGFIAHHAYKLIITSSDTPAVDFETEIKTDENGTFIYAYQLDGNYRPNYQVAVKDGDTVIATTTFTDGSGDPSHADYEHWSDKSPANWQNGALQSSNSQYFEGEVVPHYWTIQNLTSGGTYGFNIYYDYFMSQSGHNYCGFDYLAQYNTSRSPTFISGSPTADNAFPEGHGNFYTVGANVTNVNAPVTSGNRRYVQVKFTATATTAVFYWGLHMSVPGAISSCLGAHSWPGASLQTNVDDSPNISSAIDLGGGGTLQINPSGVIAGVISGYKWNDTNGNGSYDNEPKLSGWTINLCSDSSCSSVLQTTTTDASGNYSFSVTPGTYYVGEVQQSGWTKTYPTGLTQGPLVISATTPTSTNQNFGNKLLPTTGTLVVHKTFTDQHSNNNITITVTPGNLVQTTNSSGDATFSNLSPDQYTAVATEPSGYYQSASTCTDVSVSAGQTTNCTITDSPISGTITVHKTIVGTSVAFSNFCFTLSPDPGNGQVCANTNGDAVFTSVPMGSYTASETATATNYTQTNTTCDTAMTITNNGDSASCTITNTRDQGDIAFLKNVRGGTSVPGDWTFTISGNGTAVSGDTKTYDTGSYTVTESGPDNYTLTSASGACSLTNDVVALTVTKQGGTCTITNTRNTADLNVVKVVDDKSPLTDWSFSLDGADAVAADVNGNVDFGQVTTNVAHTITESGIHGSNYTLYSVTGTDCTDNTDGSSGSVTIPNGSVGTTCTFTNHRNVGSLTIHKVDQLGNPMSNVAFGISGTSTASGSTDAKGDVTFTNLPTGSYSVSETVPTDYHWTSATGDCSDANPSDVTVTTAGQSCTFTNTRDTGTLKIVKHTTGGDATFDFTTTGGGTVPASFAITTSENTGSQQFDDVPTGTYSVSETALNGWDLTGATCTGDNTPSAIHVTYGSTVTCTFDNTKLATVIVTKYEDSNADGGMNYAETGLSGWDITLGVTTQTTGTDGTTTFTNVVPDEYSLSEQLKTGWIQSNIRCYNGDTQVGYDGNGYLVDVTAGSTINCYIGNYKNAHIVVTKDVVDPYGEPTTDTSTSFSFSVSGSTDSASLTDGQSHDYEVTPGVHSISETTNDHYDFIGCDAGTAGDTFSGATVSVASGETLNVTCTNSQHFGSITVHKSVDLTGNGTFVSADPGAFTWTLDGNGSYAMGSTDSSVVPGQHSVSENSPSGYHFVGWYPTNSDEQYSCTNLPKGEQYSTLPISVNVGPDGASDYTLCNARDTGVLTVHKLQDTTGTGDYSTFDSTDFTWGTDGETVPYTMGEGQTLGTGSYNVYESHKDGYTFTGWFYGNPDYEGSDFSCNDPEYTTLPTNLDVSYGETTEITLCNKIQNPILTITKTNNAVGDQSPGGNVTFTLTVTATQSAAYNVQVVDLPSKGFTYRAGSASAVSSVRGALAGALTHIYASPGIWSLGTMAIGETVTLTYIADISADQKPGLYKDLALAYGCKSEASCTSGDAMSVTANAVEPGFVSDTYAGTSVNVVKEQQNGGTLNKHEGEVLGASTELPATGANELWLALAGLLFITGLGCVFIGRRYHA